MNLNNCTENIRYRKSYWPTSKWFKYSYIEKRGDNDYFCGVNNQGVYDEYDGNSNDWEEYLYEDNDRANKWRAAKYAKLIGTQSIYVIEATDHSVNIGTGKIAKICGNWMTLNEMDLFFKPIDEKVKSDLASNKKDYCDFSVKIKEKK